jgi:hypothetical protein
MQELAARALAARFTPHRSGRLPPADPVPPRTSPPRTALAPSCWGGAQVAPARGRLSPRRPRRERSGRRPERQRGRAHGPPPAARAFSTRRCPSSTPPLCLTRWSRPSEPALRTRLAREHRLPGPPESRSSIAPPPPRAAPAHRPQILQPRCRMRCPDPDLKCFLPKPRPTSCRWQKQPPRQTLPNVWMFRMFQSHSDQQTIGGYAVDGPTPQQLFFWLNVAIIARPGHAPWDQNHRLNR